MSESKPPNVPQPLDLPAAVYETMLADLVDLLEAARRSTARVVNAVMTLTYWEIGRQIVDVEQGGGERSAYGEQLIERLGVDLTVRFGRGFGRSNLYQMRAFYLAYADIVQTVSGESIVMPEAAIAQLRAGTLTPHTSPFPLPWSHYVRLLTVESAEARRFYEQEALQSGWSVRQLRRQIDSPFYKRTLLSRNKAAMIRAGRRPRPEDTVNPEDQIKDPFVLEFLNLKDEYSESDLEEALIHQLWEKGGHGKKGDRFIFHRECLSDVIVLNERHLRRLLQSYLSYDHTWRVHWSLGLGAPPSLDRFNPSSWDRSGR